MCAGVFFQGGTGLGFFWSDYLNRNRNRAVFLNVFYNRFERRGAKHRLIQPDSFSGALEAGFELVVGSKIQSNLLTHGVTFE